MISAMSSNASTPRARHEWADVARGIGIALVVVGHTVRGLFNANIVPSEGLWGWADRFIYGFHMPLFFVLAGVFLTSPSDESLPQLARRRIVRFGYPYLVWSSLQMAMQALASGHTNHSAHLGDLWTIVYAPPMQFWFLYALLLHALLIAVLSKLGVPARWIAVIAIAGDLTASMVPLGRWGLLYPARHYFPYTALGAFLGAASIGAWLNRTQVLLWGVSIVGFASIGLVARDIAPDMHRLALAFGLAGTAASLCLAGLWTRATGRAAQVTSAIVAEWGRASLAIFVAHTIASAVTRIVLQRVFHLNDPVTHLVAGCAVGMLAPLWMWRLTNRYGLRYVFEWPTTAR